VVAGKNLVGALTALHQRERTGHGQVVDIGIFEAVLALMESMIPEYQLAGHIRERTGNVLPNIAPSNIYPTIDGSWFAIGANADAIFRRFATAMGQPELADDERFATHAARGAHQPELDDLIAAWTITLDADTIQHLLDEHAVPGGKIYTAKEMLSDPHFQAGGIDWTGPELGQHNAEVLQGLLGLSESALAELREQRVI
jgi:succinyl-CoA--D-citramalate CoA-transferase